MRLAPNGFALPNSPLRPGALALLLAIVLQVLLPGLHGLAQDAEPAASGAVAAGPAADAEVRSEGATPAHHAESCPQCQAFAQARGHAVPAQALLATRLLGSCQQVLPRAEQRPPAAPAAGNSRPRAPPSVLS